MSVDLARAADRRAARYLKLGMPIGGIVESATGKQFIVGYDVALGVRYAPHPMVTIGLEAGVAGTYFDPHREHPFDVAQVYGALVGSFHAGKPHVTRASTLMN